MKILVAHLSQSHSLFSFQPIQWRNHPSYTLSPNFIRLLRLPVSAPRCVLPSLSSESADCNGWDDLRLRVDPGHLGESNLIRGYLNSLGNDHKKYVIVYILGFVCALAISRVRVPSIVVVPAAAIVFGIGFSFGFVNRGPRGVSFSGGKRKSKGEDSKVSVDKLRNLVKLFDEFDGRVGTLKDQISQAVQNQRVGVDDLKSYVDAVELLGLCVKKARNVVEESVTIDTVEDHEIERSLNKKPYKKRKESGDNRSNWFQLVFGFFQENAAGVKSSKKKEGIKSEIIPANNGAPGNLLGLQDEERPMNSKYANVGRRSNRMDSDSAYHQSLDLNGKPTFDYEGEHFDEVAQAGNFSFTEVKKSREVLHSRIDERFIDSRGRELNFQSNRVRFTDDQQLKVTMSDYDEIGQGLSHDALDDDVVFSRAFESSQYAMEGRKYTEQNLLEKNEKSRQDNFASSSSSVISNDILFDKYLTKAYSLLKQAKDCLKAEDNEIPVEQMLLESAKLLLRALSLKPMSLLATGLLGNTYLLHGELKLKFSQELRYLLSENDDSSVDRWNTIPVSKDELVSRLIHVCEECEELLVKAGRRYRMATSFDGNDVRALYNWGVALSFRAQLIADIGPEAASDADKLFLAAIDKFDAMMSRSKTHAPDALYRWAMVLQERSRLRPRNSKDKLRLLQQARRLKDDALEMGFDKPQVREALSSSFSIFEFSPRQ